MSKKNTRFTLTVCKIVCKSCNYLIYNLYCGESGIRTHGTVTSTTVFETVPFDHSGISPYSMLSKVEYKNKKFPGFSKVSVRLWR